MTVHKLSDAIVDKARHALGLTRQKIAYRNHYVCDVPDSDWDDLVPRGLAIARRSSVSPDIIYHLTRQSAFYFLNEGERIGADCHFPPVPVGGEKSTKENNP